MSTPVDSSHDADEARFRAQIVKELREEMHAMFICTQCRTKGNIVVVTDDTLPTGEILPGDSWALMMIKQNTRYEMHPLREEPILSGNESAAQLRRILQSTLDENRDLEAQRSAAIEIMEQMRSDHHQAMSLQINDFQVSIREIQDQIQKERDATTERLSLTVEKNRLLQQNSVSLDSNLDKVIGALKEERKKNLGLVSDYKKLSEEHQQLQENSVSLDSKHQEIMGSLKEERKKNLGLASDYEKLSEEHQQLRSNHEALQETSERVKPLLSIGIALRLRWLENIHFMFEGHNGRMLDGRIVESGNIAAHDPKFEADSLLVQHAGLSIESIERVNESMQRIYGKRHVPTSADLSVPHTYPSALMFVLDCKTAAAIHQSREFLVDYPYHQKLRLILKEMMVIWERAESREKFESSTRVEELRKEAVQIWEAVKIAFKSSKRRSRPPD
ncbi:uncharacterized protein EAE98_011527 [Botrytis deweyae]|uniref:Autophagy-related protein 11 C-terminal domain-containing protein n=1 Tax=Botrytis deweyae TaxID=2478750 RepID=A0ABQ7I5X6_9HELO|nr:uncharacterized protein EAE98_011527 [Botrytis deweyae]KAF7913502.1 hypothetical protein EAE98_011527 [Botrytis deweyae]